MVAKNLIGTLYDDNAIPIGSTSTGDGPASGYAAQLVAPVGYNGSAWERTLSKQGVQLISSGGVATVAIAATTATDTFVKASAGRLCRISITAAAGTTTGTTLIYDDDNGHTGTVLVVVPNNTAVGTIIDVQLPAAIGIAVNGGANSPGMTISYV
jgi:hypothetical protein